MASLKENSELNKPNKQSELNSASFSSIKVWLIVMLIYILVFSYTGYIAFWPMEFNDPDSTVKKYLSMIEEYQNNVPEGFQHPDIQPTIRELMIKAEETSTGMQQLASQSFNIVLGSFLAFLSATVTMIFQSRK